MTTILLAQTAAVNPIVVQVAVFGLIAVLAWIAMEWVSRGGSRTDKRLDVIKDPLANRKRAENLTNKKTDAMSRMLEAASPALAKPLQPKTELEISKLKAKLSYAGLRGETAPMLFQASKFLLLCIGLVIGGGTTLFLMGMTQSALFRIVIIAGIAFYLPELIVMLMARKRKESIFLGLPDALDLMVVCVEAGLGLDQAMRKVAEEMKKSYRNVSEEFSLCNLQMQVGRGRAQALQELGARSGVEDLRALASILIQADKFGSSIAQALRVQSDSMRTRRRQIAEEKAAKTAVKLIFPLVLFIFPGIFVILVGPAAITMVNEMFPAMNGGK